MSFQFVHLREEHREQFKHDLSEAFQQGAADAFGPTEEVILPEADVEKDLNAPGTTAYEAIVDGEFVGGAVVEIHGESQHNHLNLLYVKNGSHGKGIGREIWKAIESLYPGTKVWETCTPYFEKRNIHFYVNKCGFHIVEFFNKYHPDPRKADEEEMPESEYFEGFFRFEKVMKP